jgi:hypothetical protein
VIFVPTNRLCWKAAINSERRFFENECYRKCLNEKQFREIPNGNDLRGRLTDGHVGRASPRFVKKVWADVFCPQTSLNPEPIPLVWSIFRLTKVNLIV